MEIDYVELLSIAYSYRPCKLGKVPLRVANHSSSLYWPSTRFTSSSPCNVLIWGCDTHSVTYLEYFRSVRFSPEERGVVLPTDASGTWVASETHAHAFFVSETYVIVTTVDVPEGVVYALTFVFS